MPGLKRKHFDSSFAYHQWLTEATTQPNSRWSPESYEHTHAQLDAGKQMLINGNPNTAAIAALIDQFTYEIPATRRVQYRDVRGSRVNVGAYLSGSQFAMWRTSKEPSPNVPIRVFVGTTSSIGVSAAQLNKRGAAIAAFAMSLSASRTVYITPYSANGSGATDNSGALITCDLQSNPLYINELAAHMDAHLTRYVGMYACHCLSQDAKGQWLYADRNEAMMRPLLGCNEDDIYLPSIHVNDPILQDPIKWIRVNLAKYTGEELEA